MKVKVLDVYFRGLINSLLFIIIFRLLTHRRDATGRNTVLPAAPALILLGISRRSNKQGEGETVDGLKYKRREEKRR